MVASRKMKRGWIGDGLLNQWVWIEIGEKTVLEAGTMRDHSIEIVIRTVVATEGTATEARKEESISKETETERGLTEILKIGGLVMIVCLIPNQTLNLGQEMKTIQRIATGKMD